MQDYKRLGPKTPAEMAKKWSPLLEGITEPARTRLAWVLEHESQFLQSIPDEIRADQVGAALKYVFPALRLAGPRLAMDRTDSYEEIYYALDGAFLDYTEPDKTPLLKLAEQVHDDLRPADDRTRLWRANLPGLAERTRHSIKTLPV